MHAVDGVSLHVMPGETLGIVGESGCGKSTVGRLMMRLIEPDEGSIRIDGTDIAHLPEHRVRPLRRKIQMVFQDPYSSLNPRMRAGDIVGEPLAVHGVAQGRELKERVEDLFARVGLRSDQIDNTPSQFSGGQRQRLAIARALALEPSVIVADEPVSALDVSIQAQVVNLLLRLQAEQGMAYVFIAHNLGIVQHVSDRIAVMYLGRLVETGPSDTVFEEPRHPYTQALLAAVPEIRPHRAGSSSVPVIGDVPSPISPPSGCHFHPRCPLANERCRREIPLLLPDDSGSSAACHRVEEGIA
ncbi:ATP-binding cassette domain-containing protein (plasmid) [Microvirga sp. M2]